MKATMVVANQVKGDARVLKTAESVHPFVSQLKLYGVNKTEQIAKLTEHSFDTILVPNPKFIVTQKFAGASAKLISIKRLIYGMAKSIAEMTTEPQDLLHTHDMIGLAIGDELKKMSPNFSAAYWVHDVHEYVEGLTEIDEALRIEMADLESNVIPSVDFVSTVSVGIAKILMHSNQLKRPAVVVLNTPKEKQILGAQGGGLRHDLGLPELTPLVVYSGNAKPIRGLDILINALPNLSGVHAAFVTNENKPYIRDLKEQASQLGVASRVHFLPYVPSEQVTSYISSANLGIHPIRRYPNAEVALPNKLFEYIHAGIPVVTSDNNAMKAFVDDHDIGAVFEADNHIALGEAIAALLKNTSGRDFSAAKFESLKKEFHWDDQILKVTSVYSQQQERIESLASQQSDSGFNLSVLNLPTASAGQASAISAQLAAAGIRSKSLTLNEHKYGYRSDIVLSKAKVDVAAFQKLYASVLKDFDVFHYHSRPLLYDKRYVYPTALDIVFLKLQGKKVFFHFRGTDARFASRFKKLSPFNYVDEHPRGIYKTSFEELGQRAFIDLVCKVCDGVFVPDPELQAYVPNSKIMPRSIDLVEWPYIGGKFDGARPIRILHMPSDRIIKGTAALIRAVKALSAKGFDIEFDILEGKTRSEVKNAIKRSDIIVDQLRIGWFGVFALEAMAMGKVVVSYVREDLVQDLPKPLPLVVADVSSITEVLQRLLCDSDSWPTIGLQARVYVETNHDPREIAEQLLHEYKSSERMLSSKTLLNLIEPGYRSFLKAEESASQPSDRSLPANLKSSRFSRLVRAFLLSCKSGGVFYAIRISIDWLHRQR